MQHATLETTLSDLRLILKGKQLQRFLSPRVVPLPYPLPQAGSALCAAAAELADFYLRSLHTLSLSECSHQLLVPEAGQGILTEGQIQAPDSRNWYKQQSKVSCPPL